MNRKLALSFLGSIAFVAILFALVRCTSVQEVEVDKAYLNLDDSVQFVGSETCKGCHADIYATFMHTGMGQSFAPATKAKSRGNFGDKVLYDSFSNFYYQPFWKGDSLFLKEFRLDKRDTIFQRIERVDYIVGSGQHTNSHIQNTLGYMHQMPFTYYTQKGVLSLPPGFENGSNSRYSRALGLECLSCHNAYPEHVEGSINKYTKIPSGINCERCHGSGQTHVSQKQQGVLVDVHKEIDYSIVNPAKLPYQKQMDVCQRCHLQGNAILKEGKNWTDFKPSMDLNEVVDVFMPVLKDARGQFIMASHPDRLRKSSCYLGSEKKEGMHAMTCITCHDPHKGVTVTKIDYYNQKCVGCHNESEKKHYSLQNNNCVGCHMKKNNTVDIPHVTVTDHFIRVYADEALPTKTIQLQDYVGLVCLTEKKPDAKLKAKAYLNFYEKFDHNLHFLDSAYYYLKNLDKRQNGSLWIQYYFLKGNVEALREQKEIVDLSSLPAQNLYHLAFAFKKSSFLADQETTVKLLEMAIEKMPLRLDLRNELAIAYLKVEDNAAAKTQIDFVLNEYPKNEEALNTLGFYYLINNNLDKAEKYFLKLLRLNPDNENAMLNMAKIFLGRNDMESAKIWLHKVLLTNPKDISAKTILKEIEE